jgi:hypothetical protein
MSNPVVFARMLAANSGDTVATVGATAQKMSTQALSVQSYALSVLQQNTVSLGGFNNLKTIEPEINNAIGGAKDHANLFLNIILPKSITVITNIDGYFNLQNALASALTSTTDDKTAIQLLHAVQDQLTDFEREAKDLHKSYSDLREYFSVDAKNFKGLTNRLNQAVNGNQGVLSDIDGQLSNIDGKITGAIVGTAASGVAIAGGIGLILVGAIAEFATGGVSTALVVGGGVLLVAGIAGAVGSGIALASLIGEKNTLLTAKSHLNAEVSLALGMQSGFESLATAASSAAAASQDMANAWGLLDNDLTTLITNVERGQTNVQALRSLFQAAAKGTVKTVQDDIAIIKRQLGGVQTIHAKPGETLNQTVRRVTQEYAKAA